ncbi:MAG: hypothetical protein E8G75_02815 [Sulfitobacter sp. SK025]|nr:MAG: hypothetical protein E8G75_02815 [Sulfitobacter sp. SK025]
MKVHPISRFRCNFHTLGSQLDARIQLVACETALCNIFVGRSQRSICIQQKVLQVLRGLLEGQIHSNGSIPGYNWDIERKHVFSAEMAVAVEA